MSIRTASLAGLFALVATAAPAAPESPAPGQAGTRLALAALDEPKSDGAKADDKTKDVPAGEIVDEAQRAARRGDLKEASNLLEKAIAKDPENRTALFLLAIICQNRAAELERPKNSEMFIRSAAAMRKLRDAHKDMTEQEKFVLAMALYNEACTYAVEKKEDKALDTLGEAIASGFSQLELLDEDEELASIRKSPRFEKMKREAKEKAIAAAREHAKELLAKNDSFKFDFKLPDLDGKDVKLSDFKGKVTIVDVWGTWCPPCRKEIPHFVDLYKKYHDKGLEIVGLNYERVDEDKVKETIKDFAKENQIPYTLLIGDEKTQDQIPDFQGFPTTLFLDRTGKVRLKVVGYHPMADLDAIVSMLLDDRAGE